MVYKKVFREFHTEQDANNWAMNYFGSWTKHVQAGKSNIAKLLYAYTGNMNVVYNRFLRGYDKFEEEQSKEYLRDIAIIIKEICQFELQEDIIVYRYTHKKLFGHLFESLQPKIGKTFTDKGFMSTTLLPDLIKDFPEDHKCNCILRLYLQSGTKGAYISFGKNKLNEYEFLLPPNTTFKLVKKYFSFKYWMPMYECELVYQ